MMDLTSAKLQMESIECGRLSFVDIDNATHNRLMFYAFQVSVEIGNQTSRRNQAY